MKKKQLTKILVEGSEELAASLADKIEQSYEVSVDKPPQKSLVMLKNLDSVSNQPFYAGEALVTECNVTVEGSMGLGVIMGEQPEKAYHIAVIDAAYNAALPETTPFTEALLLEEKAIYSRHHQDAAMAARTKVNFDTMEDYDDQDD